MPRILLVEDSPTQALQIQMLLEGQSHEVTRVGDGRQAIDVLRDSTTDVVVTDLDLPEMNGLELVESMRCDYPHVPAILVTGKGSEDLAVEALRRGAAAYVPKNRMGNLLLDTIEDVLGVMRTDQSFASLIDCLEANDYCFRLPNHPSLIAPLTNLIVQVVSGMRLFTGMEPVRLAMAMEQAISNAMFRGNLELTREQFDPHHGARADGEEPEIVRQRRRQSPYATRHVQVQARISRQVVTIHVRDEGPGFDLSLVPKCGAAEMLDDDQGRGLMMMTSFMDEVTFNPRGNEVTLIKHVTTKD